MKIIKLKDLTKKDYARIVCRSFGTNNKIIPAVEKIMDEVKEKGDNVIFEKYQKRYGKENYSSIRITKSEIKKAYEKTDKKVINALKQMIKNITNVHKAQLPTKVDRVVRPESGISVWREWRAIEKIGLYIPGGRAIYPSSVLMSAIPAKIAGCKEIIICSPPGENGQIPPVTLVAAEMVGTKDIYKAGGVEAIAAMVYGTKTIPSVYKIFGAGNSYVTAAKMAAQKTVAIDMPAGPSEVLILVDDTANPAWVAADLLADAEHGADSACILVVIKSQKRAIARDCAREIEKQMVNLSTQSRIKESLDKYGAIIEVDSTDSAVEFINKYAPEHLEIMTRNPQAVADKIQNAGSVFLGDYTAKSAGDYATGANHVLPTGGMAKMYPPLGVDAYGKWMQVQKCTEEGLSSIREAIEIIADAEQLPAHKNATSIRFR